MANDDKTEKATGKKRGEARKHGQVAKSTEVNGAVVLIAGLVSLMWLGPKLVAGVAGTMQTTWSMIASPHEVSSAAGLHDLFVVALHVIETTVMPIAGIVLAAALIVNVAQIGFRPSMTPLKPNFKRLNPGAGFKRVFSPKKVVFEGGKALTKVAIVGAVAAMALVPMLTNPNAAVGTTPSALGGLLDSGAKSIIERVLIAYALIAIVDLVWQRRSLAKQLRMSKQEVKDEFKQTQLPPEVRSTLRRRQVAAARARMMAAVPHADVVVTNPTHYAVALSYDGKLPAPVVVAKGKNLIAAQIRRIATENEVPIVPDPPLARSLHSSVEIDQMIPAELYAAVAQILAYVYKMAGRRRIAA
ncbi:MAG: flagellar biosynthesis protein FlhB [Solirubrobacteraceae bacterium]|jgi:flagellar biosynthetic protein FlhB